MRYLKNVAWYGVDDRTTRMDRKVVTVASEQTGMFYPLVSAEPTLSRE